MKSFIWLCVCDLWLLLKVFKVTAQRRLKIPKVDFTRYKLRDTFLVIRGTEGINIPNCFVICHIDSSCTLKNKKCNFENKNMPLRSC